MENKIKLIFICGSLETGRDGVGDYVRKLASELTLQGHQVGAIAINDRHISAPEKHAASSSNNYEVYRIPAALPEKERVELAMNFIKTYNPDWVSLQYVVFTYHDKGLPYSLARHLSSHNSQFKWHIMFHELAVGMYKGASLRHKIWGFVQRGIIRQMVRKLQPKAISTQNTVYQTILDQDGIKSFHLPLFGNISHHAQPAEQRKRLNSDSVVRVVIFGTIHPDSFIASFAEEVAAYGSAHDLKFQLVLIGRSGSHQEEFVRVWTSYGLAVEILGEQSEQTISETLSTGSFGISTTTFEMMEKSGTVAAMLEHAMPVLCIGHSWERRGINHTQNPKGTFKYQKGELHHFLDGLDTVQFEPRGLSQITKEFAEQLHKHA
ncbi:hypothetical protein OQY15_18795 [Pedobacter sp. MC2016-15]|uniref:hypothetical protein n=1 Tax=Pedobacter sp. MC2016-15 TaxID=2994473 RepID=UPI002246BCA4|nr:hypothetical protein [Pedobacter sp. MC2016-15]MCX2481160.1 hypothetical protein [Pedobacter sp. MC2016-15]